MEIDKGNRVTIFWGESILSSLGSIDDDILFTTFQTKKTKRVKQGRSWEKTWKKVEQRRWRAVCAWGKAYWKWRSYGNGQELYC